MPAARNPMHWFEIPVKDLERAQTFYESLLGVELNPARLGPYKMAWFPVTQGCPGAPGALVQAEGYVPSHSGTLVYLSVEDIEATLAKLPSLGGRILMQKRGIGEHGFIAHFEDCEGNRVALHAKK